MSHKIKSSRLPTPTLNRIVNEVSHLQRLLAALHHLVERVHAHVAVDILWGDLHVRSARHQLLCAAGKLKHTQSSHVTRQ